MDNTKVIYYEDELNDEFSEVKIVPKKIDENYKYIHKNVIWNACAFLLQNVLSLPIKYLYAKIQKMQKYGIFYIWKSYSKFCRYIFNK